jgi:hypothetical protein
MLSIVLHVLRMYVFAVNDASNLFLLYVHTFENGGRGGGGYSNCRGWEGGYRAGLR